MKGAHLDLGVCRKRVVGLLGSTQGPEGILVDCTCSPVSDPDMDAAPDQGSLSIDDSCLEMS